MQLRGRLLNRQSRRQHPVGPYVLDFYCARARLAVEVDGYAHSTADRPQRDERRDAWLAERGIATLRLPAELVLSDMDAAVRTIAAELDRRLWTPSAAFGGSSP